LVLVHPAGSRDQQEAERVQRLQHRIAHYRQGARPRTVANSGGSSFRTIRRFCVSNEPLALGSSCIGQDLVSTITPVRVIRFSRHGSTDLQRIPVTPKL
jgi:hypothetical protein